MSYKIPNLPSANSYIEELADFWEVQSLINPDSFIAELNISRALSKGLDEIRHEGIESEDDELDISLSEVYQELTERRKSCIGKYPFEFGKTSIRIKQEETIDKDVYTYLLLCTRLFMNKVENKVQNGIDGTLVFERLCSVVAQQYFGNNAHSYVFGTANEGNFQNKMKDLIYKIGEGNGFKNPNTNYPTKNDDGIDVVVWKDFSDRRIGKLIGFGQCKTGTSWQDQIKKLNPDYFCENWMAEKPVFPPIPIVFLSDTLNYQKNFITDQRGKLVFNRFRIMEYLPENIDTRLISDIKTWLDGAKHRLS
jgi:hypothetical protein